MSLFMQGPAEVGLFSNNFRHVTFPYLYTGSQPSATKWQNGGLRTGGK